MPGEAPPRFVLLPLHQAFAWFGLTPSQDWSSHSKTLTETTYHTLSLFQAPCQELYLCVVPSNPQNSPLNQTPLLPSFISFPLNLLAQECQWEMWGSGALTQLLQTPKFMPLTLTQVHPFWCLFCSVFSGQSPQALPTCVSLWQKPQSWENTAAPFPWYKTWPRMAPSSALEMLLRLPSCAILGRWLTLSLY